MEGTEASIVYSSNELKNTMGFWCVTRASLLLAAAMGTLLLPARFASNLASYARRPSPPHLCRPPFRPSPTRSMSASPESAPQEPAPASADVGEGPAKDEVVVQYVVLRRDLIDTWPLGSVVTQGCHAAVAAVWSHRQHPAVLAYCSDDNLDSMHKVCSTKCGNETLDFLCSFSCMIACSCVLLHKASAARPCSQYFACLCVHKSIKNKWPTDAF